MVEVFSTNVGNKKQAIFLLKQLHSLIPGYECNFDLEDCDNILRVESASGKIMVFKVTTLLSDFGFSAKVLQDTPQGFKKSNFKEKRFIKNISK